MAADASIAALAQAFLDASNATAGLAAGGGLTVAQVQAAVQQAVQPLQQAQAQSQAQMAALQQSQAQTTAALQALQQSQAQMTAALQALQVAVLRTETTAAKAFNGGARDGAARNFVDVPNAAGLVAPAGPAGAPLAPLRSFADLRALNGAQLATWCTHYGVAVPQALTQRRITVALAVGAIPLAGELDS